MEAQGRIYAFLEFMIYQIQVKYESLSIYRMKIQNQIGKILCYVVMPRCFGCFAFALVVTSEQN